MVPENIHTNFLILKEQNNYDRKWIYEALENGEWHTWPISFLKYLENNIFQFDDKIKDFFEKLNNVNLNKVK